MIQEGIARVVEGESLSLEEAERVMDEIMGGEATPSQFGAFVTALRLKGETPDEIAGMARVMREKALRVSVDGALVDTCGTGGDGSGAFNVSTTAAFVAAGAGAKVAKHGNRAMSGACGSADVLEAVGVKIDLSPESVARCLNEVGFGFMFAQRYHPSMRFAAGPRREIGIRTVFNILGPLTNPAGATRHLLGVADPSAGENMARVLGRLGSDRALVVHGLDGMDEITLADETQVWELRDGTVSSYRVSPEDFGLPRLGREDIAVASVEESAAALRGVLSGAHGPARNIAIANAAAALVAAGLADTLESGVELAVESVDGGSAQRALDGLVELSNSLD